MDGNNDNTPTAATAHGHYGSYNDRYEYSYGYGNNSNNSNNNRYGCGCGCGYNERQQLRQLQRHRFIRSLISGLIRQDWDDTYKGWSLLRGVDPELTGPDKRVPSYVWSWASLVWSWSDSDYEITYLPIMIFKGEWRSRPLYIRCLARCGQDLRTLINLFFPPLSVR